MVQAGGNIYTIGYKADGTAWRVGIRNPQKTDSVIGYMDVHDVAIDTSGDYERFITIEGVNYGHILDPFTGYPPEGVISCSIITDSPVLADALATAFFVMGAEKGLEELADLPGVEVILIDSENGIHMSPGAEKKFIATPEIIEPSGNQ
jgi:thiamine biosynthesis lipoprotein